MKRLLALLVAAPLMVLAFAVTPDGTLTVVDPVEASVDRPAVDSPLTICNRWRPHGSSDTVYHADTYYLHPAGAYMSTQCIANHPGANHYFCVDTWWNGVESWRHPCYTGLG